MNNDRVRLPAASLLEWVVRSILVLIVVLFVGWSLYLNLRVFLVYSLPGLPGPRGMTGPVGIVGAKGRDGPTGFLGLVGPTDPLGVTGKTGPVGPPGNTGLAGPTGRTGPTGAPNPSVQGFVGPTGAAGAVVTGATGPRSVTQGPSGPSGPTGQRNPSALGITYGGVVVGLNSSITVSFTPPVSLTPSFPRLASYAVPPAVSNIGGNQPSLLLPHTLYSISATLNASAGTSSASLDSALTASILLTARDAPGVASLATQIIKEATVVAPNSGAPTYSVNMRVVTRYMTGALVPVLIGFSASFDSQSFVNGSVVLAIAPATLLITPVES